MSAQNSDGMHVHRGQLAPGTIYFELDSTHVGDRFAIWITLPPGYDRKPAQAYPVVYVTDGNTSALLASAAAFLVAGDHLRPARPFVQVCIGYADENQGQRFVRRNRDFIPPGEPFAPLQAQHVQAKAYAGMLGADGMQQFLHFAANGQANRFLAFIETELHPEIMRRYRIDGGDVALYGHSQGGLFALWAFASGCSLFSAYGAASPALMVENSRVLDLYRQRAAQAEVTTRAIRLHVVLNDLELTGSVALYRAMGRNCLALLDLVERQRPAGLDVTTDIRHGETHFSGMLDSYRSFLRTCYSR
jgi:uncharacterized protein